MAEIKSQFFNGKTYSATDFVESNKNTMRDGILPDMNYFKVLPVSNMQVAVQSGRGWVQGHAFSNSATLPFTLSNADGVLDRIDTVIVRLNLTTDSEKIECLVVKGTLGGGSTLPVRDGTYYDLIVATITVTHGTTVITSAMITDKRSDASICGWSGAVSSDQFNFDAKVDKSDFGNKTTLATTNKSTVVAAINETLAAANDAKINANAINLQNRRISTTAPSANQSLCYDGAQWSPKSIGSPTLIANGQLASDNNVYHLNFSQSASNFRYLAVVISGNNNIGYEDGRTIFIPVGSLPISFYALSICGGSSQQGFFQYTISATDIKAVYIKCYGSIASNNIQVWGVL